MNPAVDDPWSRVAPRQLATALRGVTHPWWVAGGWSIELFTTTAAREHADIDISCFREDVSRLRHTLLDCSFYAALNGALLFLEPADRVAAHVRTLWCRLPGSRLWDFELMIEERHGDDWCFRRDPEVRLPVTNLTWKHADGVRVLRPEVQLLYKAKDVRPRDEQDFRAALPQLSDDSRQWLADAIARVHPEHEWLDELRG